MDTLHRLARRSSVLTVCGSRAYVARTVIVAMILWYGHTIFPVNEPRLPTYWYRAPQTLSGAAGMHRFLWDIHYQPIPGGGGGRGGLPIAAVPHDTVPAPSGPWAPPGRYTVKLTVDGKSYTQALTLNMDPRVTTPALGLAQQFTLSKQLYDGILDAENTLASLRNLRASNAKALAERTGSPACPEPCRGEEIALQTFDQKLAALEGQGGGRGGAADGPDTLNSVIGGLNQLMGLLQGADVPPTTQLVRAVNARRRTLVDLMARWSALRARGGG